MNHPMNHPMNRPRGIRIWVWAAAGLLAATGAPALVSAWQSSHLPQPPAPAASTADWVVPGELVVEFTAEQPAASLAAFARGFGLTTSDSAAGTVERIATFQAAPALVPALVNRLRSDSRVAAVEPQRLFRALFTPNDPRFKEQWNFQRIHAEKAWDITRGRGAVVAVIDTGVAFEQDAKCYQARDFKQTKFTRPYDFIHRDKHPTDDNGHGTHVAGTIAESTDNGEGVAGIAFEASVMPIKVLRADGSGRMSDIAAAIRYAADNGAQIINMSLGAPWPDAITRNACRYARQKGVTIVCAAGNGGSEGVSYPAAYPDCVAVSALGPTGELAPYSSWGAQVAISAPGGDKTRGEDAGILQNTVLSGREAGSDSAAPDALKDDYFSFQGTSMASPHVAGVAALVVSQGVKDPAEVKAILQKSAQKRGPKNRFGAGELDAAAAAQMARGTNQVYLGRLGVIGALWVLALGFGGLRRSRAQRACAGFALAVTVGLLLPEVVTLLAGFDSAWNLVGHSVLLPGYLLVAEAEKPAEKRFLGILAAALAAHLGADLVFGAGPVPSPDAAATLPWLWANVVVGLGALISAFRR